MTNPVEQCSIDGETCDELVGASSILEGDISDSSGPAIRERVMRERLLQGTWSNVPTFASFKYGWPKAPVFVNGPDSIVIPKPDNCGHPGPHGYGGLCFPCHAQQDALARSEMNTWHDLPKNEGPFYRPAAQSRNLSAGIGVWQLREERKPVASAIPEGEGRAK